MDKELIEALEKMKKEMKAEFSAIHKRIDNLETQSNGLKENKGIYDTKECKVKVIKPRVSFPTPTPSPFTEQLHRDNMELIKFLNSLKNKLVWFK